MRRHARVLALIPARVVVGFGFAMGLLYAFQDDDFGTSLVEFAKSLPIIGALIGQEVEAWAVSVAGFVAVFALAVLLWLPAITFWNLLMRRDEATFFRGFRRPLWTRGWFAFEALSVPLAAVVVVLLVAGGRPDLAGAYVVGLPLLALLGIVVVAGGGRTYGSEEELERPLDAATRITGSQRSSLAVAAIVIAAILAAPAATVAVFLGLLPAGLLDLLPAILVAEAFALSAILAIEGWREYRIFRDRFEQQNRRLPEEPPDEGGAAIPDGAG
jgi:hypothetical protein